MADPFILTAQLRLRPPKDIKKTVKEIRKNLKDVKIRIDAKISKKSRKDLKDLKKDFDKTSRAARKSTEEVTSFGKQMGLAAKRYAAFLAATGAFVKLANEIGRSVGDAIAFQRELVKISQVTGKSLKELRGLQKEVTRLATSFGVASKELLGVARVLAQTGLNARQTQVAMAALAKTTLAPTFDDINKTAEGAVAILRQFGQGVTQLEAQLGSINAVAKQFAVESSDIITAVRRTGGVFQAAGGTLEEFIALFTSVRATTRETAETIATGLRTIFTRIQRPKTIEFMRQFGVELQNMEGNFVGPYEAVQRLAKALNTLDPRSADFSGIVEQLGGFRQVGKVIPLINQMATSQAALQAAMRGTNSLSEDAKTAQQALAVQFAKVREEFDALIRKVVDSDGFQTMAKFAIKLASSLIQVADALTPLLPMFTMLAGMKIAGMMGGFASAFGPGADTKKYGGNIRRFARGGFVPGTGNTDSVPAMLQPGEFVIKKSSVKKMGASTLEAMNNNRFNDGGEVPDWPPSMSEENRAKAQAEYDKHGGRQTTQSVMKYLKAIREGKKFSYPAPQSFWPDLSPVLKGLKVEDGTAKEMIAEIEASGLDPNANENFKKITAQLTKTNGTNWNVPKEMDLDDQRINIKAGQGGFAGAFPDKAKEPKQLSQSEVFGSNEAARAALGSIYKYGSKIGENSMMKAAGYTTASIGTGENNKALTGQGDTVFDKAADGLVPLITKAYKQLGSAGGPKDDPSGAAGLKGLLSKSAVQAIKGSMFEGWMRQGSGRHFRISEYGDEDAIFDFADPTPELAALFTGRKTIENIPTDAKINPEKKNQGNIWLNLGRCRGQ